MVLQKRYPRRGKETVDNLEKWPLKWRLMALVLMAASGTVSLLAIGALIEWIAGIKG